MSRTAGLSSKQRPNADVTMKIWALGVSKQRTVSIKLLICDDEILEIAYAQKKLLKTHRNLPIKGLISDLNLDFFLIFVILNSSFDNGKLTAY